MKILKCFCQKKEREKYLNYIKELKRNSGDKPFITIQDYSELGNFHSCFLIDSHGDVISQGYHQNDCVNVGNILRDGLTKCWNNPIFNHKGHFLQYAYTFLLYIIIMFDIVRFLKYTVV